MKLHAPALQTGVAPGTGGHAASQRPQWALLVASSTQLPLHAVIGRAHVAVQTSPRAATTLQNGVGPEHCVLHEPHVSGNESNASHPVSRLESQSAQPESQVSAQTLAAQRGDAFGPGEQECAHEPQWVGSAVRSKSSSTCPSQSSSRSLHCSGATTHASLAIASASAPPSPPSRGTEASMPDDAPVQSRSRATSTSLDAQPCAVQV